MVQGFKKSIAAGGPAHHLAEYTVMDNPYQGIHGGWKVKSQPAMDLAKPQTCWPSLQGGSPHNCLHSAEKLVCPVFTPTLPGLDQPDCLASSSLELSNTCSHPVLSCACVP